MMIRQTFLVWVVVAISVGLGGSGCDKSAPHPAEGKSGDSQGSEATETHPPAHVKHAKANLPDDLAADESGDYGADFTIEGDPITLAEALDRAAHDSGPFKVAGRIDKVCQKMGCWFELTAPDVDQSIRVRMKDYGFFVPRNTRGRDTVVEGRLEKRHISQKEARHYADEQAAASGHEPVVVDGDRQEWQMMITAAKIDKS